MTEQNTAPIVILGSGLAGYGVAKEFRKLDGDTPLLIITADDGRSKTSPAAILFIRSSDKILMLI